MTGEEQRPKLRPVKASRVYQTSFIEKGDRADIKKLPSLQMGAYFDEHCWYVGVLACMNIDS
jgi:hypothetical protein